MATSVLQRPKMAQKTRARQSGLELLRILCMLFIIADHYAGQSGAAVYDTLPQALLFALLGAGSRIGCSIFVMIGAWFLCVQPFRTRRVLNLWLSLWLYTVPLTILCYFVPGSNVGLGTLRWAVFPVSTKQLWFVAAYVVLLLLSPALNLVLHTAPRRTLRGLLAGFGVLLVGYSTLFAEDGVFSDVLWTFAYEYLLIGYLRIYPDNRLSRAMQTRGAAVLALLFTVVMTALRGVAALLSGRKPAARPCSIWNTTARRFAPRRICCARWPSFSGSKI